MRAFAYVKCGRDHENGICEDTVLLGHTIHKCGYLEMELEDPFVVGIADGVGGSAHGEMASGMTMLGLSQMPVDSVSSDYFKTFVSELNREVTEVGMANHKYHGMASTLTAMVYSGEECFVGQVGNTRLYQVVDLGFAEQVVQITEDHNRINDFRRGIDVPEGLEIESIEGTPQAEYLTSYIGMPESYFLRRFEMVKDLDTSMVKRFFLTSDGVHDHIPPELLQQLMQSQENPRTILENIVDAALQGGSGDDISVIMVQ